MVSLSSVLTELQKQRNQLQSQLSGLDQAIQALSGSGSLLGKRTRGGFGKRRLSVAARARIAAAQRARWAKVETNAEKSCLVLSKLTR